MSFFKGKIKISPIVILIFLAMVIKLYLMMAQSNPNYIIASSVIRNASIIGLLSHGALFIFFVTILSLLNLKERAALYFAFTVNFSITLFAHLDYLYASFSGFQFRYSHIFQLSEGITHLASLKNVFNSWQLLLYLDLAILTFIIIKKLGFRTVEVKRYAVILGNMLSLLYFVLLLLITGLKHLEPNERQLSNWSIFDLNRTYNRRKLTYPVSWAINGVYILLDDSKPYPLLSVPENITKYEKTGDFRLEKCPSILIIQVESLLRGVFEWEYNGQTVMPFMREMAAENAYFPFTYVHYGMGSSFDAVLSVLSSFPPEPNAVSYYYALNNPLYFVHLFRETGFLAQSYANSLPHVFDLSINCIKFGFSSFSASADLKWQTCVSRGKEIIPGDREYLQKVAKDIYKLESKFINYAITMTSHPPYDKDLVNNPEVKSHTNLVIPDNGQLSNFALIMNYIDNSLKEMMAIVRDKVDSGDLVIVIYGDHGQNLDIPHAFDFPVGLEPEAMKFHMVPMVIVANRPEIKKGTSFRLASLTDIPMTLCQLFNIPFEKGDIGGRNIFADDLGPLYTAHFTYIPDKGPREITKEEQNILEYGWGKLGARR